jgi:predicted DNA-binding ribbon-helix-helix protein
MVSLRKRSIQLAGHATSVALEPEFWAVLEDMARARELSLAGLIAALDAERGRRPLASSCRVAALAWVARDANLPPLYGQGQPRSGQGGEV